MMRKLKGSAKPKNSKRRVSAKRVKKVISAKTIEIHSPTRVDLAGGTLDLWPLFLFVDGALTVNVSIDVKTHVSLRPQKEKGIHLISKDINLDQTYSNLEELLANNDSQLKLFQSVLKYYQPKSGFQLMTHSESPVGGGLGGSSSLMISLIKAFLKLEKKSLPIHKMVHLAHNLEAQILNTPTGTQDYYPAIKSGLHLIQYSPDSIKLKTLSSKGLSSKFLLVYTGKSHHSGINNFEVLKNSVEGNSKTLKALIELNDVSKNVAEVCQKSEWNKLGYWFQKEFEWRVQLAESFCSPQIQDLSDLAMKNGAEAVKICGAGGGGCVLIWVDPQKRARVIQACEEKNYQVLNAKPLES